MAQRVELLSIDEVKIIGEWVTAPTTIGAAILLHHMHGNRKEWLSFQNILSSRGIASLAIDLRGHGESVTGPGGILLDYKKFTDEEHASGIFDVRAVYEWIQTRGITRDKIVVVGASIGANLALQFLSDEPQIPAAILLSPGVEYHGVNTLDYAYLVAPHQAVQMVAADEDTESAESCTAIMGDLQIADKSYTKLKGKGHGVEVYELDKELMNKQADWLREIILNS